MKRNLTILSVMCLLLPSCELLDRTDSSSEAAAEVEMVSAEEVAVLLSSVELGQDRMTEVYDAVKSSSANGYDEEYTMSCLFSSPGKGVGDPETKSGSGGSYERPLRELFREYFAGKTKAGMTAEEYLAYLENSDMQIYWPYSENWDGESFPVITFEPEGDRTSNKGWYLEDGEVKETTVDEDMAQRRPVWVINRNDDAGFQTLDVMRRDHPEWEEGGHIVIGESSATKTSSSATKSLILKDITMMQHYDNIFRGGSEFVVRMGSVEDFTASTEAELRLYNPKVTEFMVVVKRKELGKLHSVNTLLVSDWTDQLESAAFMLTEDDGGTITTWSCSAIVKYSSKSYGFDISLPLHSRDDVVWRGQMSRKYIEANDNITGSFGDTRLTFQII